MNSNFDRKYFILYFAISSISLLGAYFIEYILGHKPCQLCIYQRIPYYIIFFLSSISLWPGPPFRFFADLFEILRDYINLRLSKLLFKIPEKYIHLIISIIFLSGFLLGVYHSGVEQGFFSGLTGCSGSNTQLADNIDDVKNIIFSNDKPSCDHVDFTIFSISLASWNAIISLSLFYVSFKKYRSFK